jgi:hypothetical protein
MSKTISKLQKAYNDHGLLRNWLMTDGKDLLFFCRSGRYCVLAEWIRRKLVPMLGLDKDCGEYVFVDADGNAYVGKDINLKSKPWHRYFVDIVARVGGYGEIDAQKAIEVLNVATE